MKILAILVVFAVTQANTGSSFINSGNVQNITSHLKGETTDPMNNQGNKL